MRIPIKELNRNQEHEPNQLPGQSQHNGGLAQTLDWLVLAFCAAVPGGGGKIRCKKFRTGRSPGGAGGAPAVAGAFQHETYGL
ncbi:MAG TPA: hypothetical protein VK463_14835 [Desulfomonilaceae bacterium]|nr:hypothetical protein [Desulfomonilaceae bacterium]